MDTEGVGGVFVGVTGIGVGVFVGGTGVGVFVGGTGVGVFVGGTGVGVSVGGTGVGVFVGGTGVGVSASGTGVGVSASGTGIGVSVGGTGVGVTAGGTGVGVGTGVPHPTKSNRINAMLIIWRLIFSDSFLRLGKLCHLLALVTTTPIVGNANNQHSMRSLPTWESVVNLSHHLSPPLLDVATIATRATMALYLPQR